MKKWLIDHLPWLAACAVGIRLTPVAFQYAYAWRGYKAIGGEIFVPFLVPMLWYLAELISYVVCQLKEEPPAEEEAPQAAQKK